MIHFSYTGRDSAGQRVEGSLQATNLDSAIAELKQRSIMPTRIQPQKASVQFNLSQLSISQFFKPKVSLDDLIMFCRQMAALTRSGIPLLRGIGGLAEAAKSPHLADILREVLTSLQSGSDLATSLGQHKIFSPLFVSMIHMGETTGRLDIAFEQLIGHLELEKETAKRIKSATRYPMMVVIAISVALGVINWLVIPNFSSVFSKLGADLPVPTKILIATSNFSVNYWWLILATVAITTISWMRYINTAKGRMFWDQYKLRLPLMGHILERITIGRFTRPFAMMLDAGVPLLQSLKVSARTVGNVWMSKNIEQMATSIERGETLFTTASASGLFNPLILQMISVGEETGNVSAMLYDISDFYEQEVDYDLKRLAESIEPILLVFMGIMVLVLALGVFLPMWDLSSAAT